MEQQGALLKRLAEADSEKAVTTTPLVTPVGWVLEGWASQNGAAEQRVGLEPLVCHLSWWYFVIYKMG